MEKNTLMLIDFAEWYKQSSLASAIRDWFEKNGTIAFEHGFKAYIVNEKEKWRITMALKDGIELIRTDKKEGRKFRYAPYSGLPKQTLLKVIRICNDYYRYCLTEA